MVEAFVRDFDVRYGLTEMDADGETLRVPGRAGEKGDIRRVRIAASDVSLAPDRPLRTSILNILAVRVAEIHPLDDAQVNVVLTIGHLKSEAKLREKSEIKLLARISRRACETLGFVVGQDIYAQVKAVSLIATGQSTRKKG